MKKLLLVLFVLACATACAQAPNQQIIYKDSSGITRVVSADHPLPTSANVSIGSVSVTVGSPPDVASHTVYTTGPTAVTVVPLANRQNISVWNVGTETVWIGFSVPTPTVGIGTPLYAGGYFSLDLDASVVTTAISATPSTLNVLQTGY